MAKSKNIENELNIQWITEKRFIQELLPYKLNPRRLTDEQKEVLEKSIKKFGLVELPVINLDNTIIAGHQRITLLSEMLASLEIKDYEIEIRCPNRQLTEEEVKEYNIRSNKNTGEWDYNLLQDHFSNESLLEWGFNEWELEAPSDDDFETPDTNESAEPTESDGINYEKKFQVVVDCEDEHHQEEIFNKLKESNIDCRVLTL